MIRVLRPTSRICPREPRRTGRRWGARGSRRVAVPDNRSPPSSTPEVVSDPADLARSASGSPSGRSWSWWRRWSASMGTTIRGRGPGDSGTIGGPAGRAGGRGGGGEPVAGLDQGVPQPGAGLAGVAAVVRAVRGPARADPTPRPSASAGGGGGGAAAAGGARGGGGQGHQHVLDPGRVLEGAAALDPD